MSTNSIRLRPYTGAEIEELRKIERAAYRRYLSMENFTEIAAAPTTAPENFETGTTTFAEADGRPVGYVIVQPLDDMLYIASLVVHDSMSGRGIGRALLRWAEHQAGALGASEICLATFRAPSWNAPWYRKLGYVEIQEDKIGPELQTVLDRHSTFLDMTTRITMWKPAGLIPE